MRNISFMLSALALATLVALAGCASKTVPEKETVQETGTTQTPTTDITKKPMVSTVESQPVDSEPSAVHESVTGLERIHFAYNEFVLDQQARVILEQNAVFLRKNPGLKIIIEGHCDERGSDEYNLALGERRAVAARNYLITLGIAADRLSVISYGEEQPLVAESNEAAWGQNRRDEFKVVR